MQSKTNVFLILCLLFLSQLLTAQTTVISYQSVGQNKIKFTANLPELITKPGAPRPAFYTYYWEFGDGHISREESPTHLYTNMPTQEVAVYAVENYSDKGDREKGRMAAANPSGILSGLPRTPLTNFRSNRLQLEPSFIASTHKAGDDYLTVAGDQFAYMLSYTNKANTPIDGELYLFYNEKSYRDDNFVPKGNSRVFHGEKAVLTEAMHSSIDHLLDPILPTQNEILLVNNGDQNWNLSLDNQAFSTYNIAAANTLRQANSQYKNSVKWNFWNMQSGENRRVFQDFETIIDDVTATVYFQVVFVPNNGGAVESYTLNMRVVSAHDPNKIEVDTKKKDFTYQVDFQNEGEGAASKVNVNVELDKRLKQQSVKLLDARIGGKKVKECKTKSERGCVLVTTKPKEIVFEFKGVNLAGTQQPNVKNKETVGYVKYELRSKSRSRKIGSKANIVFDKQPPIMTNRAIVPPDSRIDFAVKGGFNNVQINSFSDWFAGAAFALHRPSKWYYQGEIMLTQGVYNFEQCIFLPGEGIQGEVNTYTYRKIELVPGMLGYEITPWLRTGVGLQFSFLENLKHTEDFATVVVDANGEVIFDADGNCIIDEVFTENSEETLVENFSAIGDNNVNILENSAFVDVNMGLKNVRLGGRYYMTAGERFGLDNEVNVRPNVQIYAEIRF